MIDLSLMNGVRVAPDLSCAYVEGGATWADVDAATTPFDRATPGGLISAMGVAGLSLSGGMGWLRGTCGLSCDNIAAADVVTSDGHLVRASEFENADLLWALKGGGGNFGVVVYLRGLDDSVIAQITEYPAVRPSEMTFASIWKFGGAVQRVPATATAFGDRSMSFMFSLDAAWSQPSDDEANIGWVRGVWLDMQRHSTGRMYLNFPGLGEWDNLVRDGFGAESYARLQKVKRAYDPGNLFHLNQNMVP